MSFDNPTNAKLLSIASHFKMVGVGIRASRIGSGHINDSYLIETDAPHGKYVLQRINHSIFKNVEGLMSNIALVTRHLGKKIEEKAPYSENLSPISLIEKQAGNYLHAEPDGSFWRLYNYIHDTVSYDRVESPSLAFAGGNAFGRFQYLTADLPGDRLVATIPDFHHMGKRLATFHNTVANDPKGRVKEVLREIDFVLSHSEEMMQLQHLIDGGEIPLRVTHNDTKFNNILFTSDDKAACIVDLDTVMPGTILYDFGDAIRTGTNTANEDEADLWKVNIDMALFRSYTDGYLSVAKHFLTRTESENLAFSARFMTFIIGLRFLTDHIDGDNYYRIHFPNHNLQRARAQFKLVESMEQNRQEMERIVNELAT
jgi:hypothetical protein